MRIEILHAETGPIDASARQRLDQRLGQQARVEFDRMFGMGADIEMPRDALADFQESRRPQHPGRAAAPMDADDAPGPCRAGDEFDLAQQRFLIDRQRRLLPQRLGVTAAIGANLRAKRDVKIKRERRRFAEVRRASGASARGRRRRKNAARSGSSCSVARRVRRAPGKRNSCAASHRWRSRKSGRKALARQSKRPGLAGKASRRRCVPLSRGPGA